MWNGTGGLERLEGRSLLAAISWTGFGGDMYWDNPANWASGDVPQVDDDVFIPALPIITAVEVRTDVTVRSVTLHSTFLHAYNLLIQPGGSLYPTEGGNGASTGASIMVRGTLRGTWNLDDITAAGDPYPLAGQVYVEDGGLLDGVTVQAGSVRIFNEGRVRNGLDVYSSSNPLAGGGAISVFGELTVENTMSMTGDLIAENTQDPAEVTIGTASGPQTTLTLYGLTTNAPQSWGIDFNDGGVDSRLVNRGVIDDALGADGWGPITTTIRTDFFENRQTVRISENLRCYSDWLNEGVIEIPSTANGFYAASINLIPALKDGRNGGIIRNQSDEGHIQINVDEFYNEPGATIRGSSSPSSTSSLSIRANEPGTGIENVFLDGEIDPRYSTLSIVDCTVSTSSLEHIAFADASVYFHGVTILNAGKTLSPEALHAGVGEAPMWEFGRVNVVGGTLSLDADGDDIMVADSYDDVWVSSLTGVTLHGMLDLSHRASNRYANVEIRNGLSGSGRIRVSGQTATSLHVIGDQVWTGVTIELAGFVGAESDLILEPATVGGSVMLTLDPLVRVEGGRANIRADVPGTNATLLNSGIIRANVDEALLQVELDSLLIEGAMLAENGGFLLDNSGHLKVLSYGQIECRAGSGVTLTGHILENELAGEIRAIGAGYSPLSIEANYLWNYGTIEATGASSGVVVMAVDIANTLDSAIRAKDDGIVTFYTPDWINLGTLEADGGIVHLSYTNSLSNVGTIRSRGGSSLWVDMPQFDNLGTVEADGGLVKIDPAGALAWHNYGTIKATPAVGSMMHLSGYFSNAGDGQIIADGPVLLEGEFLLGGDVLDIVGTGTVTSSGAMFQYGSIVLAAGQTLSIAAGTPTIMDSVDLTGPGRVLLETGAVLDYRAWGTFAMNSVLEIGPGASLRTDGPQTWIGDGIVRFAGIAGNLGRLVIGGAQGWTEPSSLQFAGEKIHGAAGRIEPGAGIDTYFELASLLSSDGAQGIEIITDHFFAPTGVIEVVGGGTLLINTIDPWTTFAPVHVGNGALNIYDNADFMGAVTIDAPGTMRIADGLTRFQQNSVLDLSGGLEIEPPAAVELRGSAVFRNGRIAGPGTLNMHDEMTWLDGDLQSQAAVVVHPGAVLTLESSGYRGFDGSLTNNGTVFVRGGTLQGTSMSHVQNDGDWKFDVPAGQAASVNAWSFVNTALVQQMNSNSEALLTTITTTGQLQVLAGDMFVTLIGTNGGLFDVRQGAALTVSTVGAGIVTLDTLQFTASGPVAFEPRLGSDLVVEQTLFSTGGITTGGPGRVDFKHGAFSTKDITVSGGMAVFHSIDGDVNSSASSALSFALAGGESEFLGHVTSYTESAADYVVSGGTHHFWNWVVGANTLAVVEIHGGTMRLDVGQDWASLATRGGTLQGEVTVSIEQGDFRGGTAAVDLLVCYGEVVFDLPSYPVPSLIISGEMRVQATTIWRDGAISLTGGVLINSGLFTIIGGGSMEGAVGVNKFRNDGTIDKVAATTATIGVPFEMAEGVVRVTAGQLRFTNVLTSAFNTLDGYWDVRNSATLSMPGRAFTTNAAHVLLAGSAQFLQLTPLTYNTGTVEFLAFAPFGILPDGGTLYNEESGELRFDTNIEAIVPFLINNDGLIRLEDNRTLVLPGGTSTGTFDAEYASMMLMGTQHLTDGARLQGDGLILLGYSMGVGTYSGVTTFSGTTTLAGNLMYVYASDGYESNGMHLSNDATLIRVTGSLNFQGGFLRGAGTVEFADGGVMGIFEEAVYPYTMVMRGDPGADNDLDIRIAPGGAIYWVSGIFASSYVTIDNDGLFEMAPTADLMATSGAYSVLNNDLGILRHSTGTGSAYTTSLWLNPSEGTAIHTSPNGLIEVIIGTLPMTVGTMSGTVEVWEGGTIMLAGQTIADGGFVAGAGRIYIGRGTGDFTPSAFTTFSGTSTLAGSDMHIYQTDGYENNGMLLTGTSTLVQLTGTLWIHGGGIVGPGTVSIEPDAMLVVVDNPTYHREIFMHGTDAGVLTINIAGNALMQHTGGTIYSYKLTINNDGLFLSDSSTELDGDLLFYSDHSTSINNVLGTYRKVGAGRTSYYVGGRDTVAINTDPLGRIEGLEGTLPLPPGQMTGVIDCAPGATLLLGAQTIGNGALVTGAGRLVIGYATGVLTGAATTTFSGTSTLGGGLMEIHAHDGYENNGIVLTSASSLVRITGSLTLRGGVIRGPGAVEILSGGRMTILDNEPYYYALSLHGDPNADNDLDLHIATGGVLEWFGGSISSAYLTIDNDGLFEIESVANLTANSGAYSILNNDLGTLRKSGSGQALLWTNASDGTAINTSANGRIEVLAGAASIPQGSTAGALSVSEGASARIGNYHSLTDGARLVGDGLIAVDQGSQGVSIWGTVHAEGTNIAIGSASSQGSVQLSSSASVLLITGTINWHGGWIIGAGTLRIAAGGSLNVIPGLNKHMYGVDTNGENDLDLVIESDGQLNYSASQLAMYFITIASDGLILLDTASGSFWDAGGGGAVITSNGVLRKTGAGSFALPHAPQTLSLPGRVEVMGGSLTLPGVQQVSGNTLTGGRWIVSGASTLNLSGASLTTIGAAASVELLGAGSVFSALNGLHTINGLFRLGNGRNFTTAGSLTNSGTLLLGTSWLAVNGNFTQTAAGVMKLDIAGKLPNQYGHLTATGVANLGGRLEIQTVNFVPRLGDEFRIIDAASRFGTFSQALLDRYAIEYDADGVTLRCEGPFQNGRNRLDDVWTVHP
ncbi:MAG: hypothetical protein IT435_02115 [Phycisphaerales bacterium]|nr:hypothetical protein [Phycisphaerales bacterium]